MHLLTSRRLISVLVSLSCTPVLADVSSQTPDKDVEKVTIWAARSSIDNDSVSPAFLLQQEDMQSINAATTEDIVKYAPSIVIRRRFIGDANGTLGLRGSNMFQTSRSMVFADGVPLHYLLQSRWSGAPRWTMVSASEIAQVEVLYGPFSAEYSGNAMGGVVLMETAIPQQREVHFNTSYFNQQFDAYGFDDRVDGFKSFVSYGDKMGDLSLYFSYNHLQNDSQPQSFYYGGNSTSSAAIDVTGAIKATDERSNPQLFFGDTGIVETTTDNYKFKTGYDWDNWSALLNIAYEDRQSQADSANSYLLDSDGNNIWGGDVSQDGQRFSVPASRLNVSVQDRDSLSIGLRVKGNLNDNLSLEANLSQFDILHDQTRSSHSNPNSPDYTPAGQITDYDDTGWKTAEIKLRWQPSGYEQLGLVTGTRYEQYQLNISVYDSADYAAGNLDDMTSNSGGQTDISAVFAQLNWDIGSQWNITLGGRYESFHSNNGYYSQNDAQTPQFALIEVPATSDNQFSPKLSLAYQPEQNWSLRYSLAKAYRFPIVEELFSQYQAYNTVSEANPELKPEAGLHHNLSFDYLLDDGYLRVNAFSENIRDVIESQSTTLPGGLSVRTFIPIDKVRTRGMEFIYQQHDILLDGLDISANIAYTDANIIENNVAPEIEGKTYPRMPKWRGNLLTTYHLSEQWTLGANIQYASNSYGRTDNLDNAQYVYGAQDKYCRLGLKSTFAWDDNLEFNLGVDNLSNKISYVAHPWPGRTWYFSFAYDM
ncbi:TonB-dependent receptor [Neptunicella sp. SCSIO 80796]|uniref:TonB-dependent receptor n=1 Tax=Neptunicella plasticusilytica TaxID=3117012 RepID=UPI003A4D71AD